MSTVAQPVGVGFVLTGMAVAGGGGVYAGIALAAFGFLLIALSR